MRKNEQTVLLKVQDNGKAYSPVEEQGQQKNAKREEENKHIFSDTSDASFWLSTSKDGGKATNSLKKDKEECSKNIQRTIKMFVIVKTKKNWT